MSVSVISLLERLGLLDSSQRPQIEAQRAEFERAALKAATIEGSIFSREKIPFTLASEAGKPALVTDIAYSSFVGYRTSGSCSGLRREFGDTLFYAQEEGGGTADSLVTTISAELQQLAYTLINGQGRGVCCVANAVVKLYDTASVPLSRERGPDAPRCFLLRMELLEPVDSKRLAALDPVSWEKAALKIMRDVLEGLFQMHSAVCFALIRQRARYLGCLTPLTSGMKLALPLFRTLLRPTPTRSLPARISSCGFPTTELWKRRVSVSFLVVDKQIHFT